MQRAWISLRHRHPHIAAVADTTGHKFEYTVPLPLTLEAWIRQTLIIHPDEDCRSAEQLEAELEPTDVFMLHYIPHSRQLLFRAPHWRTDGRGMILLQHEFCTLLAADPVMPVFDGSEAARLAPPFTEVAGLSYETTPEMGKASDEVLGVLFSGSMIASVRESLPNAAPTTSRRVGVQLPLELSKRVIAASKARGQTVTTTVHAALVTVMRRHADVADGRAICFNPFDLRDRLPAPWNGSAGCANLYHTGKPCSIDFGENPDFDAVANHLSAFYRQDLGPLFDHMVDYTEKIGGILAAPLEVSLEGPGAARPELSSLGIVDRFLQTSYTGPCGTFEIEDWWLGVQIINRLLQMYLWTRDGRIHLGCNYNEAFYETKFAEDFVNEWRDVLVTELLRE